MSKSSGEIGKKIAIGAAVTVGSAIVVGTIGSLVTANPVPALAALQILGAMFGASDGGSGGSGGNR